MLGPLGNDIFPDNNTGLRQPLLVLVLRLVQCPIKADKTKKVVVEYCKC